MTFFNSQRISIATVVLLGGLTALCGCGSSGPAGPKTVAATGKVTYNDKPVADANVAFLGDGTTEAARAITDANGEFVLSTTKPGDGAVPGQHKVTVTKMMAPPKPAATDPKAGSMEAAAKQFQETQNQQDPKALSMIPEKYSQAASSTLQYTVEEGKTNRFEIKLTD